MILQYKDKDIRKKVLLIIFAIVLHKQLNQFETK